VSTRHTRRGGPPEAVGDILAQYIRSSGLKDKLRSPKIYDCWPQVAGDEASAHTRVVGFTNAVLHVEVDSAPWLQMLATFRKPELLQGLRGLMNGVPVKDIRFRVGSAPDSGEIISERNPWQKRPSPPTTRGT